MKNKKWLAAVIAVLVALVIALVVLIVILFVKDDNERNDDRVSGQSTENTTEKVTGGETSDPIRETDGEEDPTGETNSTGTPEVADTYSIVIDGFEFNIPSEYDCFYNEEVGPVIESENVFQMSISVGDKTYQEVLENRDKLTDKAVNAGGEIVQEPTEIKIDGREFIYFVTNISDEKIFLMYTQGADTDKAIAGQLVLFADDVSNEEVLKAYAGIVADAKETDKPDSTLDDIVEQTYKSEKPDGAKSESTLTYNMDSITFGVPEGFYSSGIYVSEYSASESFFDENYDIMVDCILRPTDDYENAETYIETMVKWETGSVNDIKVKTERVGDIVCYYFVAIQEYEDKRVQNLYAAYNNSDTSIYTVEVYASDIDYDLSFDMFRDFLNIKDAE